MASLLVYVPWEGKVSSYKRPRDIPDPEPDSRLGPHERTVSIVYAPPVISPTHHLLVLRHPTFINAHLRNTEAYLSPSLHNVSDSYIRLLKKMSSRGWIPALKFLPVADEYYIKVFKLMVEEGGCTGGFPSPIYGIMTWPQYQAWKWYWRMRGSNGTYLERGNEVRQERKSESSSKHSSMVRDYVSKVIGDKVRSAQRITHNIFPMQVKIDWEEVYKNLLQLIREHNEKKESENREAAQASEKEEEEEVVVVVEDEDDDDDDYYELGHSDSHHGPPERAMTPTTEHENISRDENYAGDDEDEELGHIQSPHVEEFGGKTAPLPVQTLYSKELVDQVAE